MFIDEGIVPMNFDWRSEINKPQRSNVTLDDIFITQDPNKEIRNKIKSNEMQYRNNANMILGTCITAANNLIIGNSRKGITETDISILQNSIYNKIYEILNGYSQQIDNGILLEQIRYAANIYYNEYQQNCIRNGIKCSTDMLAWNSDNGVIMFNPRFIVSIVEAWTNSNCSHIRENDIAIFE